MSSAPALAPTLTLADGGQFPAVGLGFWKIPKPAAPALVREAVHTGYRHLDCACDYGNEPQVGEGIATALRDGLCRREDLWVTSKLWNTYHEPKHVRAACERSLRDLRLDYLDLYLVHFPIALAFVPFDVRYPPEWFHDPKAAQPAMKPIKVPYADTWGAMEDLVRAVVHFQFQQFVRPRRIGFPVVGFECPGPLEGHFSIEHLTQLEQGLAPLEVDLRQQRRRARIGPRRKLECWSRLVIPMPPAIRLQRPSMPARE